MEKWTPAQYREYLNKPKKRKYGNKISYWEGVWQGTRQTIKFESGGEMDRFCELKIMYQKGLIEHLQLQKKFELIPKRKGERALNFVLDFFYIERGQSIVEDFKSEETRKNRVYINKRKHFKQKYPDIEFRESGR